MRPPQAHLPLRVNRVRIAGFSRLNLRPTTAAARLSSVRNGLSASFPASVCSIRSAPYRSETGNDRPTLHSWRNIMSIRLSDGRVIPMEMHKVRIVQKVTLPPMAYRLNAIAEAGYNTFLLPTRHIFLDMLTDSGTNAMSDNQLGAMMVSDDAYAGSESFTRLAAAVKDVLGFALCMPVHQGRAAEHLLAKVFVKPGSVVIMNYHFTTSRAHIELAGGKVLELLTDEGLRTASREPF